MQSNDTNDRRSCGHKKQPWYRSQLLAILLLVLSIFNWIFTGAYVSGQLEIKPTMLILKRDGCEFFRQNGIPVQDQKDNDSCKVTVPFRGNMIGSGGRVFLGDRQIMLADNQVVVVAALEDQPWTPRQQRLVIWLGGCLAIIFGMMAWIGVLFSKKDANDVKGTID